MRILYHGFSDNDRPLALRFAELEAVCKYFTNLFKEWQGVTSELESFVQCTTASLRELYHLYGEHDIRTSSLSTLVVENFFSLIRMKVWYPTYYEFSICYSCTRIELLKKNCKDSLYHHPNHYFHHSRRKYKTLLFKVTMDLIRIAYTATK